MPSTLYYIRVPKSAIEKSTRIFPKPLPNIKVPVRLKPIRLGHPDLETNEGGWQTIGKYVTQLFREERIELFDVKAHAVRPYAERLIQLAIAYGDCHKPTMEVCDFYLKEKDLIHKLFKVLVPRYRDCATAYTNLHRLPRFYGRDPNNENKFVHYRPALLEMKGNPYPPVVTRPEDHRGSLLNVLLDAAKKQHAVEKQQLLVERSLPNSQEHSPTRQT